MTDTRDQHTRTLALLAGAAYDDQTHGTHSTRCNRAADQCRRAACTDLLAGKPEDARVQAEVAQVLQMFSDLDRHPSTFGSGR